MSDFAHTIVYRHPCHCASASRALADGEAPQHRFEVDGIPFPYAIHEDGPTFTRLADDLWQVDLTLYPVLLANHELLVITVDAGWTPRLRFNGVEFPWTMTAQGFTIHATHRQLTSVRLGFLARDVDTDGHVTDARPAIPAVS